MTGVEASPVAAEVTAARDPAGTVTASVTVDPAEIVLAGHYPGLAIFPGVCVVECVHRAARQVPPQGTVAVELVAIDRARFLAPAFPGDRLDIELTWSADGDQWRCRAQVRGPRGPVAQVRLRYGAAG